jgi:hypothetical protein
MSDFENSTIEELKRDLEDAIETIADLNHISINKNISLKRKFSTLIRNLSDSTNKRVVVLIDEYDKPLLDNIDNERITIDIQKELRKFYGALKSSSSYLKLVFITGISKFTKASIFSDLNNLKDLTLNRDYSTICGYTYNELEKYFEKFISHYANTTNISYEETIKKIKGYYDGYSWDGDNFLYNPYSIMNFFDDMEFKNYWFETGTPNFLVKIFKENFNMNDVYNPIIKFEDDFAIFDITNLGQIPLLFQAGYLTISKKELGYDGIRYTLKIPNFEVEKSITKNLFDNFYGKVENNFRKNRNEILDQIKEGNCELLGKYLKKEIISIDYHLKIRNWKYYQSIILFAMKALNFNSETKSEVAMFSGRMDIAIEDENTYYPFNDAKGHVIIMEVKYTRQDKISVENLADKAINQIKYKGYYEKYDKENLIIVGLGIKEIELNVGSKIDLKCIIEKMN